MSEKCLILQYDGELIAIKVMTHIHTLDEKKIIKAKNFASEIANRMTGRS